MANPRTNTVLVTLLAAVIVPRIEQLTGVKLTVDDVGALMALAVVVWHGGVSAVEQFPLYVQKFHSNPTKTGEASK